MTSQQTVRAAILGASGYTGAELLRLLRHHPLVDIVALSGDSKAGMAIGEVYPHLQIHTLPALQRIDELNFNALDVVFCCLPHAMTQEVVATLPESVIVVDLSADFRLFDTALYETWYGRPHQAPELQQKAVYGLSEHAREAVKEAQLIANPGCYPTSVQLPLIPLLEEKRIKADGIVVDAKSGVTGAGRKASENLLFTELNDGFSAYAVGKHRHTPEIEQGLSEAAGEAVQVRFTPHLVPMNRGILSTIYVDLADGETAESLYESLSNRYRNEPFVHILPSGQHPSTAMVRGTNHCMMNVFADRIEGKAVIVSVIDNLVKGASGQAVQNLNIRMGWDETYGLQQTAVFP